MDKRLLSVEEAARYLGLKPRTLYNQTARRAQKRFPIRPVRFGSRVLFDRKDLDQYIDSLKIAN